MLDLNLSVSSCCLCCSVQFLKKMILYIKKDINVIRTKLRSCGDHFQGWGSWLCTLFNIHYEDFQLPERGTPLHRTIMTSSVSKVLSSPIGLHCDYHCSPTTIQKRMNSQIGIIFPHMLMCPHPLILYDFHLPVR